VKLPVRDPRVWLLTLAVLAPLISSVSLVLRYGVDVPIGDQWWIASMFSRGWGFPSLSELLSQANECRPVFPKLLFIALAHIGSAWNVRHEMLVTQGLVALVAAGLIYLWHNTIGLRPLAVALPLALVSAWLFAPAQYDNFFWGMQLMLYVPFACLTGVLVAVAAGWRLAPLLIASGVLALIATYSFSNGMTAWLLAVPVIAWTHWGQHTRHWLAWLTWASVWAASAWLYFHDLEGGAVPSAAGVLRSPIDALLGALAYIGSALSVQTDRLPLIGSKFEMAIVAGSGVVVILLTALAYLLRTRRAEHHRPMLLWGTVAGYGLLSGVLTVVGRFSLGPEYMLTSRYVAFSSPVLVGTIALATLAVRQWWISHDRAGRSLVAGIVVSTVIGFVGLTAWSAHHAVLSIEQQYRARLRAKAVLNFFQLAEPHDLRRLVPWSDIIVPERAPGLLRVGIRRDDGRATSFRPDEVPSPSVGCVEMLEAAGTQRSRITGWSFLVQGGRPADAILVTAADHDSPRPTALAVPSLPRSDVPAIVGSPIGLVSGWAVTAPVAANAVKVWAYDVERNEAYAVPTTCLPPVR
jgi:hypothetical protein